MQAFPVRGFWAIRFTVATRACASPGARIGDGDGRLDPELTARTRLAFGDAFNLGRMQGVDLVLVVGLLRQECLDPGIV
jgi:hypothetical protein